MSKINYKKYQEAYTAIKKAQNILLVTHSRPDGDAISSVCALIKLLENIDKKYFAYCSDEPPKQFNFLPQVDKIIADKNKLDFPNYDLIIAADCGSLDRTKLTEEISGRSKNQFVIEFDHHPKIDNYSNLEIRIPDASSTAEVLYNFFIANKIKINKDIATCILTGILTDTANFLYPSASNKTINIASLMLRAGARYSYVLKNTWRNKSLPALKIWGQAMSNLKINPRYNLAYSILSQKQIAASQASEEELEGIAGFLSNLHGVQGLLLLREEDKKIKGSLRTAKSNVDISRLAQFLGGGGHTKAAGFTINARLEQTGSKWEII